MISNDPLEYRIDPVRMYLLTCVVKFIIDIHLTFIFFIAFHNFFLLLLTVPPGAGVRSGARRSGPAGGTSAASSAAQSSTISAHRFAANSSPAAFTGENMKPSNQSCGEASC
jgi:hypothetical protein